MKNFAIIILILGISISAYSQSVLLSSASGKTTTVVIEKVDSPVPDDYNIYPACPNVFGPNTTIKFDVPERSDIKVNVYDRRGRFITNLVSESFDAGVYSMNYEPSGKNYGMYNFELLSGDVKVERKFFIVK